jgi:hypothetical protein
MASGYRLEKAPDGIVRAAGEERPCRQHIPAAGGLHALRGHKLAALNRITMRAAALCATPHRLDAGTS